MSGYYSSRHWRALREATLARDPLCVVCLALGQTVPAVAADHIIPRSQGGADALSNTRGLCLPHHNSRRGLGEPVVKGCDASGRPLSPLHWWHGARGGPAPVAEQEAKNSSALGPGDRSPISQSSKFRNDRQDGR